MQTDLDSERSRRLLFAPELAAGTVRPSQLARAEVRAATLTRRVPARISRAYQRRLMRRGALGYERGTIAAQMAARRAVLGDAAAGPPRLLVRVDSPPGPDATERLRRLHAILAEAQMPYLVGVRPRVALRALDPSDDRWRPLDDDELALLAELRRDGVAFAANGLDHRTRVAAEDRRSELAGLDKRALAAHLDRMEAELATLAVAPTVFAVPFHRFDWRQWETLSTRYDVVCGGEASVAGFGFHDTPLWRGQAVWMPAYAPFDGPADGALAGARRLAEAGASVWVPVVLHAVDEAQAGWEAVRRFAREAAKWAVPWEDFLDAVRASRT